MHGAGDECDCEGPYNLRGRQLRHVLRRLLEDTEDDQGPVRQICLADNDIGWLPKRFCTRHTGATHICMHNNKLVALPDDLRFLTQLQRLCLSGNQIVAFPEQIDRMINLHTVILDGNFIRTLPEGICSLRRLENLSIDCPYLEALPSQFGRIRSLKQLNMGSAPVVQYPYSVRYLTNLETLEIAESSVLWKDVPTRQFAAMGVQDKLRFLSERSLKDTGAGTSRNGQFFRKIGGIHGLRAILKFQPGKPLAKDIKYRGIDYKQTLLCGHHQLAEMHLKAKQQPAADLVHTVVPMLAIAQELAARGHQATILWLLENVRSVELKHRVWRSLLVEGCLPPHASLDDVPMLNTVSPATFAAATGNVEVLRALAASARALSSSARPLSWANFLSVLSMRPQKHFNPFATDERHWLTPCLEAAVKYHRTEVVEWFLAEVLKRDEWLQQPFTDALCQALDAGFEDIALRMIAAGVNCLNLSSQHVEPPIMYACRRGLVESMRAILARYPQPVVQHLEPSRAPDNPSYSRYTTSKSLIAVAAAHGHADVVEILAQHGLSVNASSEFRDAYSSQSQTGQDSPLMAAAKNGHVEALSVLLRYGADPHVESVQGLTPLMYAIERRAPRMVAALLSHGASANAVPASTAPPQLVATGPRNAGYQLAYHVTGTKSMETPLQVAVRVGELEIVRMLLAAGADPNLHRTPGGNPPLTMAAGIKDNATAKAVIAELLARGASINHRGDVGSTALTEASRRPGALEVVKQLVGAGATCHPDTLTKAAKANAYDTLIWLIYNGGDPSPVQLRNLSNADTISTYIINAACRHVAAVGYENI